jgi:elongation factor G
LRVLDGAVAVFCAVAGVQPQSETVWKQADKYGVPRIAFVNKMDRTSADFFRTLKMMKDRLGANAVPVQLPIGAERDFRGVIDLIEMKALVWHDYGLGETYEEIDIPSDMINMAEEYREQLVEAVAENDENILIKYLDEEDLTHEDIIKGIKRATINARIVPVLCGAALKNKGIQPLLNAIVHFMPSPLDIPAITGINPETGKSEERLPSDDEPLAALVFKIVFDPHMGKLAYVRVYSGTLQAKKVAYNATRNTSERVERVLRMHANKREDVSFVGAGDIAGVLGLRNIGTGDSICSQKHPILLEPISFPEPVIFMAVEPKTAIDQEKMSKALTRLTEEDPTFKVKTFPSLFLAVSL